MTTANIIEQSREARRRVSRRGAAALVFMLLPGILFPIALWMMRHDPRFIWLGHVTQYPWELWIVAGFGGIATVGGAGDWLFHRSGETSVGLPEHRAHVMALGTGGIPLFGLMAAASVIQRPQMLLIPVVVVVIYTVVLICYDEFLFHRRCRRLEKALHRMLTYGNGVALLAWMHWCFVRGGAHG